MRRHRVKGHTRRIGNKTVRVKSHIRGRGKVRAKPYVSKTLPGKWRKVRSGEWKHPSGLRIWVKEFIPAHWTPIGQREGHPATTISDDVYRWRKDAIDIALEYIHSNPEGA